MRTLILILSFSFLSVSAQVSPERVKSAYLLRIADDFTWPHQNPTIKVAIYSPFKTFFTEFKSRAENKTIDNRKIVVEMVSTKEKLVNYDIVFVEQDYNRQLFDINKIIKGKSILLISNATRDLNNSMVDFTISQSNKIKFQINKSTLQSAGFTPSKLLLILGGTGNEVLDLFEEQDSTLLKAKALNNVLKKERQELSNKLLATQKKIDSVAQKLILKNIEVENKEARIDSANTSLKIQKTLLIEISNQISKTKQELLAKEKAIAEQRQKINTQSQTFNLQKQRIAEQRSKILTQNETLNKQGNALLTKQRLLNYAIVFVFILAAVLSFAVVSFVGKRKSSSKLAIQNERLKNALTQLQNAQSKLIQNEKMASLGMVTAGMAHEINNPMAFIYTGISILKTEVQNYQNLILNIAQITQATGDITKANALIKSSETIEDFESVNQTLTDVESGAKRVTDIINSLENFSQLDRKGIKEINISEAIASTLTILGSKARKKGLRITQNITPKNLTIQGFPAPINQVFMNLIANAIDACPHNDGEIAITAINKNNVCIITVKDNGLGIKENDLGKIFDPFFTTKKVGEGTGLGLSITYNIIKKHNGKINAANQTESGAVFTVELPIKFSEQ